MRKFRTAYSNYLKDEGYGLTFPKKHVRILWAVDTRCAELIDFEVADFSDPDAKDYLYKRFSFDIGNCLSDWDDWTLVDVLMKLFVSYQVPFSMRKHILLELSRIEEWRPELAFWLYCNFADQSKYY